MVDDARLESCFELDDAGSPGKDDGGIPEDEVRLPIEDVGLLEGPVWLRSLSVVCGCRCDWFWP